jgi:hypothetical protein
MKQNHTVKIENAELNDVRWGSYLDRILGSLDKQSANLARAHESQPIRVGKRACERERAYARWLRT